MKHVQLTIESLQLHKCIAIEADSVSSSSLAHVVLWRANFYITRSFLREIGTVENKQWHPVP
jgi:hypothetical protein